MSSLLDIASGVGESIANNQDNKDLIADMNRLISVCSLITSNFEGFVEEIAVAPVTMLSDKLSNIKRLKLYIAYNSEAVPFENLAETVTDLSEVASAATGCEFDEVTVEDAVVTSKHDWTEPTLTIYTSYALTLADVDPKLLACFYEIIQTCGNAISIPSSLYESKHKVLILHVKSLLQARETLSNAIAIAKRYEYTAADVQHYKKEELLFTTYNSLDKLRYDIPYLYINADTFSIQ